VYSPASTMPLSGCSGSCPEEAHSASEMPSLALSAQKLMKSGAGGDACSSRISRLFGTRREHEYGGSCKKLRHMLVAKPWRLAGATIRACRKKARKKARTKRLRSELEGAAAGEMKGDRVRRVRRR